jgi:endonuclease-3 related protein
VGIIYPIIYELLYDHFGPQDWWPADTKEEIVIGAILTQNTAWPNVVKALNNLKKNGKLSLEYIRNTPRSELAKLIRSTGYFNQKSERLKIFVDFLFEKYDGKLGNLLKLDTTKLRPLLISLKGIGYETADDIILYAAEKPVFVIDSYTKRILNRHLLCGPDIEYNELQKIIENETPRDVKIYNEYHALFVKLAKEYCVKKNPICEKCPLKVLNKKI